MKTYVTGTAIRLTASFQDENGAALDPAAVTLKIKSPTAIMETFTYPGTVTKQSQGLFYYDYIPTEIGIHEYRAEGAGGVVAAAENKFTITSSAVL